MIEVKHRIEDSYTVTEERWENAVSMNYVVRWFPPDDVIPRGHWNCSLDGDSGIQYAKVCDHVRAVRKWKDQHE